MNHKEIKRRIKPNYLTPLTSNRRARSLSPKAQQQLDQASKQGYLVTRGFQQPVAAVWRKMCEQQRREYLRVRQCGKRFASIYLDVEPAGRTLPAVTQDRLYHLGKLASSDFVSVGKDHLFVCKVPTEKIDWVIEGIRFVLKLDAHAA